MNTRNMGGDSLEECIPFLVLLNQIFGELLCEVQYVV